jgi:enamine deaminase RidA (YjgF/YER057c/UK114 family)
MPPLLVPSPSPYAQRIGFSAAVRAGDRVLVAGTTAVDAQGAVVGGDDVAAQAREALRKIEVALQGAGATLAQVVLTRIHVTDLSRWEEVGLVHGEVFGDVRPVATMLGVAGLLDPRMLVEIEAEAYVGP